MSLFCDIICAYFAFNGIVYFAMYFYTMHERKYGNTLERKTAEYLIHNIFENGITTACLILYGVPQIICKYIYLKLFNRN